MISKNEFEGVLLGGAFTGVAGPVNVRLGSTVLLNVVLKGKPTD